MWYFHRRYVIIEIEGVRPEWMLNALTRAGISVFDAAFLSRSAMRARLCAKDFKKLHALSRTMPFRVRIVSKLGFPFRLLALRHRAALVFGSAALLFLFAYLAPRILVISVSGCARVPEAAVLRLLASEGVKPFALRETIDVIPVTDRVRAADERLAWVGLDIDGVRCRVKVVEAVPLGANVDYDAPCDIVAKKAGVIFSVSALNGKCAVVRGQKVAPGDVLVMGHITEETAEDQVYVHARGEITANVFYRAEAAASPTVTETADTGQTSFCRLVRIGDWTVSKTKAPFAEFELRTGEKQGVYGTLLPLTVFEGQYYEQGLTERPCTQEEQIAFAAAAAEERCYEKLPKDAAIVSKETTHRMQDGVIVAECTIVTKESIGITKEILP